MPDILTLNYLVSLGALALLILTILYVCAYAMKYQPILQVVYTTGMLAVAGVAISSFVMSLIYSEYYGIVPCGLCWFERICLYPLALILTIAYIRRDTAHVIPYALPLATIGATISLYHHYLQMGGGSVLPCPASGVSDCAKRFIFEFGFITFPFIAFIACAFIAVTLLILRSDERSAHNRHA
jgi:disulfide bond formation protein DsbB